MKEAKEYLQKAVQLMPSDPIVNDHFADISVDEWRKNSGKILLELRIKFRKN